MQPCAGSESGPDARFEPTHWSVFLAAGQEVDAAQTALAQRCRTYRLPLLAARLEMPTTTVRSHVNRLRARYHTLVRAELHHTVGSEEAVGKELYEPLWMPTKR